VKRVEIGRLTQHSSIIHNKSSKDWHAILLESLCSDRLFVLDVIKPLLFQSDEVMDNDEGD
jgi:hypothetical protein